MSEQMEEPTFHGVIYTGPRTTLIDLDEAEAKISAQLLRMYKSDILPRVGESIKNDAVRTEEPGFFVAEVDSITHSIVEGRPIVRVVLMTGHVSLSRPDHTL